MTDMLPTQIPFFVPADLLNPWELANLSLLKGGHSSKVYRAGSQVVKFTKYVASYEKATARAQVLQQEHDLFAEHLEEYVPNTTIKVIPADDVGNTARVLTVQQYAHGAPVGEALTNYPDTDKEQIAMFLRRVLKMKEEKGIIADIAHLEHGFRFIRTPNVIVDLRTSHPILVDTNLGRTQRRPIIGGLFTACIALAAERALTRIDT